MTNIQFARGINFIRDTSLVSRVQRNPVKLLRQDPPSLSLSLSFFISSIPHISMLEKICFFLFWIIDTFMRIIFEGNFEN